MTKVIFAGPAGAAAVALLVLACPGAPPAATDSVPVSRSVRLADQNDDDQAQQQAQLQQQLALQEMQQAQQQAELQNEMAQQQAQQAEQQGLQVEQQANNP